MLFTRGDRRASHSRAQGDHTSAPRQRAAIMGLWRAPGRLGKGIGHPHGAGTRGGGGQIWRASHPVRFREPGDRDPDTPPDEYTDAMHEEPPQLVHQAPTPGTRWLYLRREWLLDNAGRDLLPG